MEQRKALVVEDDQFVAEFIKLALEEVGYAVKMAFNGRSAFQQLQAFHPDLITLDLHLPDTTGSKILKQLHTRTIDLGGKRRIG